RLQDRFAGVLVDDVGAQVGEVDSGVVPVAVDVAAEVVDALVELVVADRGDLDAHGVERFDGRLVAERGGEEGAGADEVAGGDGGAVALAFAGLGEVGGEVLGAARGHFGAVLVGVGEALVRFEAAVEVVDGEQLEVVLSPVAVVEPVARSCFGVPGGAGEGGGRQRGRGGRGEAALPSHGGQWRSRFHRGGAGLTAPAADRCWDDRVREYNITDGQ